MRSRRCDMRHISMLLQCTNENSENSLKIMYNVRVYDKLLRTNYYCDNLLHYQFVMNKLLLRNFVTATICCYDNLLRAVNFKYLPQIYTA